MTEETVKANPDYVPALMLLGELYNSQKNTDKAIKIFEKVVKLDNTQAEAYPFSWGFVCCGKAVFRCKGNP